MSALIQLEFGRRSKCLARKIFGEQLL